MHPVVFARGKQRREHISCSVTSFEGYDPETMEPAFNGVFQDDDYRTRSVGEPWEHLIRDLSPGPLLVGKRDKRLVIAAGHVRLFLVFY